MSLIEAPSFADVDRAMIREQSRFILTAYENELDRPIQGDCMAISAGLRRLISFEQERRMLAVTEAERTETYMVFDEIERERR